MGGSTNCSVVGVFNCGSVSSETHIEHGNESSLQQPQQRVAPVMVVIRDSGVTHINREDHQEELDGGPDESGPLRHESGLHVQLWREEEEEEERR